jgi:hypothetical protein
MANHTCVLLVALLGCSAAEYRAPATTTAASLPVPGPAAVAIVRVPPPWYARDFLIRRRFVEAVGDYEHVPGLLRKYFTIAQDRRFGGIYLWRSRRDADAFYGPAWHARIRERYGTDADLAVFAAPFVVEGTTTLTTDPIDAQAVSYPAVATFLLLRGGTEPGERGLRQLAALHAVPPGLVRAYFVIGAAGELGVIDLWATGDLADTALGAPRLRAVERALGGTASVVRFDASVLLDTSTAGRAFLPPIAAAPDGIP